MINKIILKDKEITDPELISLIKQCMIETGGIRHVSRNLEEIGYLDFREIAYRQLHAPNHVDQMQFKNITSNVFLVICITIFVTVKKVEDDTLIDMPFEEGITLLREI